MSRIKRMKRVDLVLLGLLGLFSYPAFALTTDAEQPIHIEADKLDIDEGKHTSRYTGNVEMNQGSLNISADQIIFHFTPQNDLQKLEISGKPATFKQLNEEQKTISGSALRMHYYENESLLELDGEARFVSDADTIESERITVNTQTNALQAGNREGSGRVRMLIQPRQDSSPQ